MEFVATDHANWLLCLGGELEQGQYRRGVDERSLLAYEKSFVAVVLEGLIAALRSRAKLYKLSARCLGFVIDECGHS